MSIQAITGAQAARALLTAPPRQIPCDDVTTWRTWWRASGLGRQAPVLIALHGGYAADRPGWAFAAGYQAALRALAAQPALRTGWPGWAPEDLAALCLTEPTGNRPRDLQATGRPTAEGGWQLDGHKRWTTLGTACDQLLVVARDADVPVPEGAPPRLAAWVVPVAAPGVALQAMPPTAFVPEVPHATLALAAVHLPAAARLPGDGWNEVGKPFRTLEDTLVPMAMLAHLLAEAQRLQWPTGWRQRALATLTALAAVAEAPPLDAATHVLLAGALDQAHALYAEADACYTATPGNPAATRWARDRPLLGVARGAREQRAAVAWQRLAAAVAASPGG